MRPEQEWEAALESSGFSHIALAVRDINDSISFYAKYAAMRVAHDRNDNGRVLWLSDLSRPFVIVLVEGPESSAPMGRFAHFDIECGNVDAIDALCDLAVADRCLVDGPRTSGGVYWAFLRDPDGHHVEISYGGQSIARAVDARLDR